MGANLLTTESIAHHNDGIIKKYNHSYESSTNLKHCREDQASVESTVPWSPRSYFDSDLPPLHSKAIWWVWSDHVFWHQTVGWSRTRVSRNPRGKLRKMAGPVDKLALSVVDSLLRRVVLPLSLLAGEPSHARIERISYELLGYRYNSYYFLCAAVLLRYNTFSFVYLLLFMVGVVIPSPRLKAHRGKS